MEDELQRLWQLLAELSSQLTQNREQTEQLKKQAEELKTQAIHTGTGYALKRFNVDLSKEQFESEVERMNAQLVIENQTLQHENRHLTILLKDHETTLEQIMTRFRNHAHSTQQHELELTKYYESVILSLLERQQQQNAHHNRQYGYPDGHTTTELDPNTFQLIQNLSILIQKAMRELSGEEPYLNETDELESQQALIQSELAHEQLNPMMIQPAQPTTTTTPMVAFQDPFQGAMPADPELTETASGNNKEDDDDSSSSSKMEVEHRRKSMSVIDYRPRPKDPSSGGYVGRRHGSLSDYALQNAIETERLRRENDYLREMLGIAEDCNPAAGPTNHHHHHGTGSHSAYDSSEHGDHDGSVSVVDQHDEGLRNKFNKVISEVIEEEEEEEEQHETGI